MGEYKKEFIYGLIAGGLFAMVVFGMETEKHYVSNSCNKIGKIIVDGTVYRCEKIEVNNDGKSTDIKNLQ